MRGRPKDLPAPNGVSTAALRESNRLNEFAISSDGIGEALVRSAAALDAAGNSLDESIALITAANTIVQDPDSVGTTMKTLSMYLRAAKTEAEEAGESTDGMASSVSELRSEILALTGNRVDVMADSTSFKSTYQILKELAGVWKDLTDVSQANILEMIGGKRNSNVVAALLENFEIVEDVIQSAGDAEGSALAENEKYLESIQGHISEFKAEFQELSTNVVDSDIVKMVVDTGTALESILNTLLELDGTMPSIIASVVVIKSLLSASKTAEVAFDAQERLAAAALGAEMIEAKSANDQLIAS